MQPSHLNFSGAGLFCFLFKRTLNDLFFIFCFKLIEERFLLKTQFGLVKTTVLSKLKYKASPLIISYLSNISKYSLPIIDWMPGISMRGDGNYLVCDWLKRFDSRQTSFVLSCKCICCNQMQSRQLIWRFTDHRNKVPLCRLQQLVRK